MDQMKTGRFIASLRKGSGLTQEMLGNKLSVTNKTISRWENGIYMPDIEKLKLLSELFSVSINELLSGERLNDVEFRKEADKNIIATSKSSTFSMKEKAEFWKRKWLKEHTALIVIAILFCIGVFIFAIVRSIVWLSGVMPVIWLVVYGFLQNKRMAYVEDHIYGGQSDSTR